MKQDWLDQLAPAHAPPPPGWWPPAPGWWLLALAAVLALSVLVAWLRRPRRRLRRLALRELAQVQAQAADDRALAQALESLSRRFAVARFGREAVARLSGTAWIEFVAAHGGQAWQGAAGESLLRAAYGGEPAGDREAWIGGVRDFIRSA